MTSTAQSIASQTGLSVPLAQFLLTVSRPLRQTIRGFLTTQRSQLTLEKARLVAKSKRYDGLSARVTTIRTATRVILETNSLILKSVPLDSLYSTYVKDTKSEEYFKAVATFLDGVVKSLPLQIPASVAATIGLNDLDFFNGVRTYQDLIDRVDALEYRLARATAASTYASAASFQIDNQLDGIDKMISAIDIIGI